MIWKIFDGVSPMLLCRFIQWEYETKLLYLFCPWPSLWWRDLCQVCIWIDFAHILGSEWVQVEKTKGLSKSKIQVLLFYTVVVWFLSHKGLVFGTLLTYLVLGRLFAKDQDVYIDPKMFAKVGQEVGRFLLPADVTAQELQALIHETWRSSGTNEVETGKHG